MDEPSIIQYRNFSNKRYYSRYAFLKAHYKHGNILDVGNIGGFNGDGSGRSSYLQFVAEHGKEDRIYGFDLYAPSNQKLYQLQKQGNIEDGLPYENGFFDTVYMGELLEHVVDLKTVFDEVRRVLKDDGCFILDTPNPYYILRIIKYLFRREENLGDPTHLIFFSPASLQSLLRKFGFLIEEMAVDFSVKFRFLPMYLMKGLGSHFLIVAKKANDK